MTNKTVLRRFLYAGTTLIIIVTLITAFGVIPTFWIETSPGTRPENNVTFFSIYFIILLLIIAAFVWIILRYQRAGYIKKGLLFTAGFVLLILGLLTLAMAVSFGTPILSLHSLSALLFICSGCYMITTVMAFLIICRSRRLQPPFKTPAGLLAVLIFVVPIFVYGISDSILTTQPGTEWRSFIITNLFIITGCFFIVREKPEGIWIFPIIGNAFLIFLVIVDLKLLGGIKGISAWGGWVLSLIVSYKAAQLGNEREAEENEY